jgi:hypothetical protein
MTAQAPGSTTGWLHFHAQPASTALWTIVNNMLPYKDLLPISLLWNPSIRRTYASQD